jgi:CpeT protein
MKYAVLLASLVLAGCASTPAPQPLAELASHLTGYFSSRAQAQADKDYFDIELRVVPVWTERADGPWLYVEQAAANTPDKPYRQRVYRLELRGNDYLSHIYEFKGDPLKQAGQWKEAKPLGALTPADIVLKDGCAVVMQRKSDGSYSGATVEKACPSVLRGAKYGASRVTLDAKLLESWDQGFAEDGKQVWGATKGAYRFVKISTKP